MSCQTVSSLMLAKLIEVFVRPQKEHMHTYTYIYIYICIYIYIYIYILTHRKMP